MMAFLGRAPLSASNLAGHRYCTEMTIAPAPKNRGRPMGERLAWSLIYSSRLSPELTRIVETCLFWILLIEPLLSVEPASTSVNSTGPIRLRVKICIRFRQMKNHQTRRSWDRVGSCKLSRLQRFQETEG